MNIEETTADKFYKFHTALMGYDILLNNEKQLKWEVFASGITNADLLLKDKTIYNVVEREDIYKDLA